MGATLARCNVYVHCLEEIASQVDAGCEHVLGGA